MSMVFTTHTETTTLNNSHDNLIGKLGLMLLVLCLFGLQIQMIIPFLLHQNTTPFSIVFRAVCLSLSLYIILLSLMRGARQTITYGAIFLICFYVIYSFRFLYDIQIRHINEQSTFQNPSAFFFYSTFFGTVLIPCIAIIFSAKYISIRRFIDVFTIWSFLQVSFIIVNLIVFIGTGIDYTILLGDRNASQLVLANGSTDSQSIPINLITISKSGVLCASIVSYRLIFDRPSQRSIFIIYSFFLIVGITLMIMGASRSPLLAFVLIILTMFFFYIKKASLKKKISAILLFLLSVFVLSGVVSAAGEDVALFKRFSSFFEARESGDKEIRQYQWDAAWNQFLSSPLFGDKIIENEMGYYPHNEYLDVLMSTGLIGAFFYLGYLIFFVWRLWRFFENKYYFFLVVIFIVYWLGKLFSGSIFEDNEGSCISAFIIACQLPRKEDPHVV